MLYSSYRKYNGQNMANMDIKFWDSSNYNGCSIISSSNVRLGDRKMIQIKINVDRENTQHEFTKKKVCLLEVAITLHTLERLKKELMDIEFEEFEMISNIEGGGE